MGTRRLDSVPGVVDQAHGTINQAQASTRTPVVPTATATARRAQTAARRAQTARGAAWTDFECLCLVKAWISVSEDPLRGTYQKAEDFYQNLGDLFNRSVSSGTPVSDAMGAGVPTRRRDD